MPFYEYKCKVCGTQKEEFHPVDDRYNCGICTCGGEFFIVLQSTPFKGDFINFIPHYDSQMGEYFESAEHKKKRLSELGYTQVSGSFSPKTGETKDRIPCNKEEAVKIDKGQVNPHYTPKITVNG